jgi:hypothetical protein
MVVQTPIALDLHIYIIPAKEAICIWISKKNYVENLASGGLPFAWDLQI